tara:strand:- start:40 stop:864 length:825 start_codon:yes stop_codon:yes gene_type:complete
MDGISGIRIYDRLKVDTRFFPNYYPQTLLWVIKGVSHEIQNNKWYTKLETIAVPKLLDKSSAAVRATISRDTVSKAENTLNTGGLRDSTTNEYPPSQTRFSTNTTLSAFAKAVDLALGEDYNDSIKASVIFLARQEQSLKGFNYNYYGVQTDLRWSGIQPFINGSFNSTEGKAGQGERTANARWFASFKTEADGIKFVALKLQSKGWGSLKEVKDPIKGPKDELESVAKKYFGTWLYGQPNSPTVKTLIKKDQDGGGSKLRLWSGSYLALLTNR